VPSRCVWCLPANWRPISGSEASVKCFARYIAICRGKTIERGVVLLLDLGDAQAPNCSGDGLLDRIDSDLAGLLLDKVLSTC